MEGYDALHTAAGWFELAGRGEILVTGRDRARLLHSLTTNNIKDLAPGQGCYAFLLTPQGRIQADLNIYCMEDHFLLDTEPETRERVLTLISRYIIADDVTLEDASTAFCVLAVEGPLARDLLARAGAPVPEAGWAYTNWAGVTVAQVSATGQPGYRLFAPAQRQMELRETLARAGALRADADAVRTVRIENGQPRYGEDIFDTTLPQESRQMHAVNFNKGCYLGQEIVERVRARGHVNRLLMSLSIDTAEPPARGAKLTADGAEAGEITSAAFSPASGKMAALAYVRAPQARKGAVLSLGGQAATVG